MTLSNDTKYIVIRVKVWLTGWKYHFEDGNLKILLERLQRGIGFLFRIKIPENFAGNPFKKMFTIEINKVERKCRDIYSLIN